MEDEKNISEELLVLRLVFTLFMIVYLEIKTKS